MPTLISPSLNVAPQNAAQAGPRGRDAEQPEGRSFGAVLDRSRAASAAKSDATSDAALPDTVAARKPVRAGEKKSELSAADVMAMLAPLSNHFAPASAQAKAVAPDGTLASQGTKAVGAALDGSAADGVPAASLASGTARAPKGATVGHDTTPDDAQDPAQAKAGCVVDGLPAPTPASAADATVATAQPAAASTFLPKPAGAAASAQVAAADTAPVAATADPTPPLAQIAAVDGARLAAAADRPDSAALDAGDATDTQPLPQIQALAPAAVDRSSATAGTTPVLTVAPPVGSPEWAPAIGQQMIRMSASGHQVAELNLNPSGLGPLKVTLTMGDNQAQAMFVSAHEGVRKAVEAALPQLRTSLADQGISLGHTSVGAETRQPGQQASFAQQNPSRSQNQPDYPGSSRIDGEGASPRVAALPAARHAGGLDTFA